MTGSDTSIVGGTAEFPSTVWEDLRQAGNRNAPGFENAFNALASSYWRPVYHYIRVVWRKPNEDAKDLTQDFFVTIFDPEFLARSDPDRGSFRSFVITSLKNFLSNQERARKRIKRGGLHKFLSIEMQSEESFVPIPIATNETPEDYFDRAWARTVLDQAVESLEATYFAKKKQKHFRAFKLYCLQPDETLSYDDISKTLDISSKDVDNFIYQARKDFRRIVSDTVREYISDPTLLEEELQRLFSTPP